MLATLSRKGRGKKRCIGMRVFPALIGVQLSDSHAAIRLPARRGLRGSLPPHPARGMERRKTLGYRGRVLRRTRAAGLRDPLAFRRSMGGFSVSGTALPGFRFVPAGSLDAVPRGLNAQPLAATPRPRPASSSQPPHSGRRAEFRSLPSVRLRAPPAGTAPCSAFRTSPEDAPHEQGQCSIRPV